MTAVLAIIHAGLAAAWVGGMAYSLFVIQPKLKRYFGPDAAGREALTTVIASGNRWKVVGLIAAIALSGLGLLLLDAGDWWIHAVKGLLLLMATVIFWYVSWKHWPARVFATAGEVPALHRRLIVLATTMLGLAGLAFALGVLANHL
ncbi:hypothetical protein GCM10029976_055230 [Kribbella albertanoniae]|uniref:Copper resistance protein D domain-containing protein n=1 Tax=Kribbella albertanoniae TaxID=1266829 RepID=A0A4R4NZY5_9ACTN|nr:hypothetical protein [Kribbella albertanoniae]TDC15175.1 hypothetical protein E1261_40835 [Kribbella albertanoniae]